MEEYHVRVEKYNFVVNKELFTNTKIRKRLYIISSKNLIEDPYKYIFDLIKKDIENNADEIRIIISRKEGD